MISNFIELAFNLAFLVALSVISSFIRLGWRGKVRLSLKFRFTAVFFSTFLFVFSQAAAGITAPKTAARESIRVVMDDNYPPYTFRDFRGTLQGILVDQWALWEKKTGIPVQLDAMDWAKAQQRMEAGEYDVIDTIFTNEHRKTLYEFSAPYANIDVPLFFSRELSGIRGPKDLKGFVVGAKSGDNSIEILKASGVSNFLFFDNYEAIVAAARDGKIKVFTIDKPPALYFLIKMGIQDQFRESEPLYSGEFHRAVRKGNTALLKDVQQGFNAISKGEYEDIDRHWYGAPILSKARLTLVAFIAGGAIVIVCLLMLWVWLLRRSVRRRTAELQTDITERKRVEEDLRFSKDLYATLSAANQAIVRCESKVELFREITRTCAEFGHFELAWIGESDETGERILVTAAHGPSTDYLVGIEISTLEKQATGRGPTGTCFRDARVVVAQNWDTDPSIESWRSSGLAHGFHSNAAFPISQEGQLIAVLTLYSKEPYFFLPARIQLLAEMANNLGHALEGLAMDDLRVQAEEALRESEWFLRKAQAAGNLGCYRIDIPLGVWESSKSFDDIFGIDANYSRDISGWLDLVVSDSRDEHRQYLMDMLLNKGSFDLDYRVNRRTDGEERWVSGHGVLEYDDRGQALHLIGTMQDITERKRAEDSLRLSEEKFNNIFYLCPDPMSINRLEDGIYLDVNQNFTNIFGYRAEEVIGRSSLPGDLGIWVDKSDRDKLLAKLRADGEAVGYEAQCRRKDGAVITVLESWRRLEINGEQCLLCVMRDITEHKRMEVTLRGSEEEYHRLVSDMQVGVLIQGPTAEILLFNPKAMELLGLREDQLLGKTSFDPEWNVIHEDGTPFPGPTQPVPQAIATRHAVQKIIMGVYHPLRRDRIWLSVDAEPQLNADGTVRQVVCTFVDITDLKQSEQALRESEERFKALHNASFGGISIHDKGMILECNLGLSEMTGYSLDELIGMICHSERSEESGFL